MNSKTKKIWGILAIVAAMVAVGIHFYLSVEFYQLKFGLGTGKSVCNISETFNCEAVAMSRFAALFGIPLALFGAVTNLMFAVIASVSLLGLTEKSRSWARLALLFAVIIFAASVVMAGISLTQMKTYCLFCLTAYATSFVIFIGSLFAFTDKTNQPSQAITAPIPTKLFLGSLILVPALTWFSNRVLMDNLGINAGKLNLMIQESLNDWNAGATYEFDPSKGLVYQAGQGEPSTTLVEFVDLLCPHCKHATPTIHAFAEGQKDVRLVLKLFPLDGNCNADPQMNKGNGLRCDLSYALFCAQKIKGRGWEALNWIFDQQASLFETTFQSISEQFAKISEVPPEEMKICMENPEIRELVLAQSSEGQKAKLRGTPAIYMNGRLVERGRFIPVLEAIKKQIAK